MASWDVITVWGETPNQCLENLIWNITGSFNLEKRPAVYRVQNSDNTGSVYIGNWEPRGALEKILNDDVIYMVRSRKINLKKENRHYYEAYITKKEYKYLKNVDYIIINTAMSSCSFITDKSIKVD